MASNDSSGSFVLGFLVGGIVGAAVGLLLAPKSGQDTRAELIERSEAWRGRAEEMAAELRARAAPTVETARERIAPAVETARERVAPAVETARERVTPIVEEVNTRLGRSQTPEDGAASDAPPEGSSKNGGLDQTADERA